MNSNVAYIQSLQYFFYLAFIMISNRLLIYHILEKARRESHIHERVLWLTPTEFINQWAKDKFYRDVFRRAVGETSIDRDEIKRHLMSFYNGDITIEEEYHKADKALLDNPKREVDKSTLVASRLASLFHSKSGPIDIDALVEHAKKIYDGDKEISDREWAFKLRSMFNLYSR